MSKTGSTFSTIVGPLAPGLYGYSFSVDGVATADPSNPNVVHSTPTMTQFLVGGKSVKFMTQGKAKRGKLSVLSYHSTVTNTERRATVWTPPGYPRKGLAYPTLYLIHGFGGDYLDWVQQGRANIILDNLYASRKIPAMVVVMGDGNVPPELQNPNNDPFIPEMLDNLIPAVRANYQVSDRASKQAIAGLSLGGLQTFDIVLTRPGSFRYVGIFSSGYFPAGRDVLKQSSILAKPNVALINKTTKVLRMYTGNKIDVAYENGQVTRELLAKRGVKVQFGGVYLRSGHTWNTWQHALKDFAPRIF